jgi:FKBP-type peptidyl-prolyl cis-trans isomerase (trigger factor)
MVKLNLALNKIAEKENYSISADELKAGAETYAGLYGYEDVESFKKVVSDDVLTQMLLNDKAYNYVIENAVTEQVQVETTVVNGAE